jgi:hypothetical protein
MWRALITLALLAAAGGAPAGCRSGTLDPQTGTGASGMVSTTGRAGSGGAAGNGAVGAGGADMVGSGGGGGVISIGGAGGNGMAGGSDGDADGGRPPLGLGCVGCTMTPLNAPAWQPVGAIIFSAGVTASEGYLPTVETILAPHHLRNTNLGVFGPGLRHAPPYDDELYQLAVQQGYQPQQNYLQPTFVSPGSSLVFMVSVAARPDGPRGASADFDDGPVIPNALFPMRVQAHLIGPPILDPAFDVTIPGYDRFSPPIEADGPSHYVLAFRTNSTFATDGAPGVGAYDLEVIITDATGAGWDNHLLFRVYPQIDTP